MGGRPCGRMCVVAPATIREQGLAPTKARCAVPCGRPPLRPNAWTPDQVGGDGGKLSYPRSIPSCPRTRVSMAGAGTRHGPPIRSGVTEESCHTRAGGYPWQAQAQGLAPRSNHINPCSAIDKACPCPTMMWSSTRTSTSAKEALRVWVRCSSARLGWTEPLGWLWLRTTAAA